MFPEPLPTDEGGTGVGSEAEHGQQEGRFADSAIVRARVDRAREMLAKGPDPVEGALRDQAAQRTQASLVVSSEGAGIRLGLGCADPNIIGRQRGGRKPSQQQRASGCSGQNKTLHLRTPLV